MSYLNVTDVSHTFGGRQILENVSFKLLRGEHVGLVGANGEGKSTFLNIVTGHLLPDEGKVEWPGRVTVGYLDQQSTLEAGQTIREVLRTAFNEMYEAEKQMLELYDKMADATPEEMDKMMNTVGEIQSELEHSGFYSLDTKIEEVANGLGLGSIGLDRDVSELSGGQRSKVLLTKLLLQNSSILLLDEPHQLSGYRAYRMADPLPAKLRARLYFDLPRYRLPQPGRQRHLPSGKLRTDPLHRRL